MSTSTYSSSAPWSWTSESDFEERNTWNELLVLEVHYHLAKSLLRPTSRRASLSLVDHDWMKGGRSAKSLLLHMGWNKDVGNKLLLGSF